MTRYLPHMLYLVISNIVQVLRGLCETCCLRKLHQLRQQVIPRHSKGFHVLTVVRHMVGVMTVIDTKGTSMAHPQSRLAGLRERPDDKLASNNRCALEISEGG